MRVMIDACVLYPTVMREVVLRVAATGAFEPIWSARVLEEWARAAIKLGPTGEAQARGEIALLRATWPRAERAQAPHVEASLWLPDENDIHVFAVAVDAGADAIMTLNAKDFPRNLLAEQDIARVDPDGFLIGLWPEHADAISRAAEEVLQTAQQLSGTQWDMRALLKKARLPRLAKTLTR